MFCKTKKRDPLIWLFQQIQTPQSVKRYEPVCKYQQAGTAADHTWTRITTGGTSGWTAFGVNIFDVMRAREIIILIAAKKLKKENTVIVEGVFSRIANYPNCRPVLVVQG